MKILRNTSAVLLALLVMVSSTHFTVGLHLCSGEIQNIALFSKAERCQKVQSLPPCHRVIPTPCCDDQTVIHEAQELKASIVHAPVAAPAIIDFQQASALIAEVIPEGPALRNLYQPYDPPLRACDLTVAHQVFLI